MRTLLYWTIGQSQTLSLSLLPFSLDLLKAKRRSPAPVVTDTMCSPVLTQVHHSARSQTKKTEGLCTQNNGHVCLSKTLDTIPADPGKGSPVLFSCVAMETKEKQTRVAVTLHPTSHIYSVWKHLAEEDKYLLHSLIFGQFQPVISKLNMDVAKK